jgi:uncharacterized protein YqeY
MSLQAQLMEEMKQAMRDRDVLRLGVIRFLRSEIKNVEIDQGALDDAAILKIISKQIKQMQEAVEQFTNGGRPELAAEEQQKIAILETYLPAQLSDEELELIVSEVIAQTPEPAIKTVMPAVIARVAGRADGRRVSQLVQAALQ